ncbi:hypothetical protein [Clostridium haemolyticum]|uniref:Uncharacterized protein n=1 Tax=Clostridium haemolyticum NCTC 9693 TaxID=1443114 RepID=A0ABR4TE90_CLOHA|nr:hypothetical protein [Clostridium haemolyticum]KEI16561.1 hypothetical protein Z960_09650 [Clostridium haemolyticum NCTC 9693]KGN04403.1 hypothetical protein Z961_03675 [Clostridium haemolyticum NCTC 8350]
MIKRKKILNVLSKAAIGAIISASFSISAYASADGVLTKSLSDGKYYYYSYDDLVNAYVDDAGALESKLFNDYMNKELIAIHDDKNGFVDYKAIEEALLSEEEFDLDNFIKDSSDKVEISSEVISVHANEEGEIFTENYEVKNNIVKDHEDVQPELLKEDKEEKVNPVVKNEEEITRKLETVEKNNEVNFKIQSNLVQHYVRGERGQIQTGHLAFKFKGKGQNKLQNPQTIKILDKTIQLNAGDDSSIIKRKILNAFEGNSDWKFDIGYVVVEGCGASVEYTCKRVMENVDKFAEDTSEIKFIQEDDCKGTLGVLEEKEVCEVTVNSASNKQETIKVTLKDTKANITLATATININPQDDTRKIAELLYNELKSKASRLYDIKLEKESSKIILKQRLAMNAGTTVILDEKITDDINHELVKEEKGNEVIKNVEYIQPSTQEVKDVQPEPLKEDKEENHSKEKKEEPIVKNEELPKKIEVVERDNEAKKEEFIAEKQDEKNLEIQSNLVQSYVRGERGQIQTGHLAFKFKGKGQNKLQNPQTIKILDKTIQLNAGDDSSIIKRKILNAFEGNSDWKFDIGYVVVEGCGASVEYTCKRVMENVDKFAEDTSEIKFIQEDDCKGTLGVLEEKEVCEVTVNSASNKQETIKVTLKDTKANITLATATININPQDDTRKIAELLYNELKSKASRLYDIKLEKESSKIILKQRLAMNAGTIVSIEI